MITTLKNLLRFLTLELQISFLQQDILLNRLHDLIRFETLRFWKSIKSDWMRHVEQFGVRMIFNAYESKLYLIKKYKYFYNKKKNFFIFNILLKCHLFLWCKTNISASLLQSSVSHDPSDVIIYFIYWLGAQEIFIIIKKVKINSIYWKWKSFVTL